MNAYPWAIIIVAAYALMQVSLIAYCLYQGTPKQLRQWAAKQKEREP